MAASTAILLGLFQLGAKFVDKFLLLCSFFYCFWTQFFGGQIFFGGGGRRRRGTLPCGRKSEYELEPECLIVCYIETEPVPH